MKKHTHRAISLLLTLAFVVMLLPSILAADQDKQVFATLKASAIVGEAFSAKFLYGLPEGDYTIAGDLSNATHPCNLAEYGLSGTFSNTAMTISGTPVKSGTATYTIVATDNDTQDVYTIYIEIAIAKAGTEIPTTYEKTLEATATVGEAFSGKFLYDLPEGDYSVTGDRTNATHPYNLSDYGLSGTFSYTAMTISGTPTKVGTATYTIVATDNDTQDVYMVYIEIHITEAEIENPTVYERTLKASATIGETFSEKFQFELPEGDYTVIGDLEDETHPYNLADYGLSGTFSYTAMTISGTPTKVGTATYTIVATDNDTKTVYRIHFEIDITEKFAAVLSETIFDGQSALKLDVSKATTFEYILYWTSSDKAENGITAGGGGMENTSDTTIVPDMSIIPSTYENVYYYVVVTADAESVVTDTVMFSNPNYKAPAEDSDDDSDDEPVEEQKPVYQNPFTDVTEADWFYEDVMIAVNKGLVNGKTLTTYVPNGNLKICEAIKLAACMNQKYNEGWITLENAPAGQQWYMTYVNYAIKNGIITYDQFEGRYNDFATRAEYVMIFANALPDSEFLPMNSIADDQVSDVKKGDICYAAVYKLYRAGILTGSGSAQKLGWFEPDKNIRRSEVAAILTRMMDKTARKVVKLG